MYGPKWHPEPPWRSTSLAGAVGFHPVKMKPGVGGKRGLEDTGTRLSCSQWAGRALQKVEICPRWLFPGPFWSLETAPKRTFSVTLLGTEVRLRAPQILLHGDAFLQPSGTSPDLHNPTVASGGHRLSPAEPLAMSHSLASAQLKFPVK